MTLPRKYCDLHFSQPIPRWDEGVVTELILEGGQGTRLVRGACQAPLAAACGWKERSGGYEVPCTGKRCRFRL